MLDDKEEQLEGYCNHHRLTELLSAMKLRTDVKLTVNNNEFE